MYIYKYKKSEFKYLVGEPFPDPGDQAPDAPDPGYQTPGAPGQVQPGANALRSLHTLYF